MQVTREIIAENIARLRKANKLTQAELAEKLNYSDKAVSKWERGDSIPDVIVLADIAELFSVTVDYFLREHSDDEPKPKMESHKTRTRAAISLTSCFALYAIAIVLYFIFVEIYDNPPWRWKLFVLPLPIVAIEFLVFSAVWSKSRVAVLIGVSAILWTSLLAVFIFLYEIMKAWLLFVIGAPLQAIILFWLLTVKRKKTE